MSTPHERAAVHSLPSFAQAFSALSADHRDDNLRALPPLQIHAHHSPAHKHTLPRRDSHPPAPSSTSMPKNQGQLPLERRKRARPLESDDGSSDPSSPRNVKQEQDVDQLDPSPSPPTMSKPSRSRQSLYANSNAKASASAIPNANASTSAISSPSAAPPPSLARPNPPSKRRRVTISGVALPLNTANLPRGDPNAHTPPPHGSVHTGPSTPISPVVMGFTIQRDPQAMEQVRAMLAVKQKQKAIIESRRGSAAGLVEGPGRRGSTAGLDSVGRRGSIAATPSVNIVNSTPTSATAPMGPVPPGPRRTGTSPNGGGVHRLAPTPPSMSPNARPSGLGGPPGSSSSRTRSPSQLGGGRALSPSQHIVMSQSNRAAQPPPPTTASTLSNRSPPSQHPHAGPSQGQVQSQSQSQSQSQALARPQMPSPPKASSPASGVASSANATQFVASQGLSALANNLPPPPNSFARRRAGQLGLRGNKPADIMISPRETNLAPAPGINKGPGFAQGQGQGQGSGSMQHSQTPSVSNAYKMLQPAVQSAPPRPGQQPGRFPMALPSLPPALGRGPGAHGVAVRKTPGQVPPTPTRLSMQRAQGAVAESASVRLSQPTGAPRVPLTATAATFTTRHGMGGSGGTMPVTPATLHRASNTRADKAAFLAPFEKFYDALSDAQVLKGWFSEQLRRVGKVVKDTEGHLERQKEEVARAAAGGSTAIPTRSDIERMVAEAVQQEAQSWREEVTRLRTRVAELEEVLYERRPAAFDAPGAVGGMTKSMAYPPRPVNGMGSAKPQRAPPLTHAPPSGSTGGAYSAAPGMESYTFPPVQPPQPPLSAMHRPPASGPDSMQRSVSPVRRAVSRSEGSGARSVSRSTASSPAPTFESGMFARRLSVSAMRYEPRLPVETAMSARPGSEDGARKNGERERERAPDEAQRPNSRKQNGTGGGSGTGDRASSSSPSNSAPAPMDES